MKQTIHGQANGTRRKFEINFLPYKNEIKDWNFDKDGWGRTGVKDITLVTHKPTTLEYRDSLQIEATDAMASLTRTFKGEPDTDYIFTIAIRNEGALNTRVTVGDTWFSNHSHLVEEFTKVVKSDENGEIDISLDFHHVVTNGMGQTIAAWIGGLMITPLPDEAKELPLEDLTKMFKFSYVDVNSPKVRRFVETFGDLPPDAFLVVVDGVGVNSLDDTLEDIEYVDGQSFEVFEKNIGTQISDVFLHDLQTMSMLEGDPLHLTYMFPEEERDMSYESNSNFPRLQFYTGFEVNRMISDGKPMAASVNYAVRFYLPTSKVLESLNAQLLVDRMNKVMKSLKWSPIRGSDMFIKQPKIFSIEVQYIKDVFM